MRDTGGTLADPTGGGKRTCPSYAADAELEAALVEGGDGDSEVEDLAVMVPPLHCTRPVGATRLVVEGAGGGVAADAVRALRPGGASPHDGRTCIPVWGGRQGVREAGRGCKRQRQRAYHTAVILLAGGASVAAGAPPAFKH